MGKSLPDSARGGLWSLLALLSACGSTRDPGSALSYDPALQPGQVFFNPQAAWVQEWAGAKPPSVPQTEASPADPGGNALKSATDQVPWTVVKNDGRTETLAPGIKPIEIFTPHTLVASEAPRRTSEAFERAEPESPWVDPSRGPAGVSELASRSNPKRIIPGDRSFPLANSLAVESARAESYYKFAYSWEIPRSQIQPFFADDGRVLNAFFFVRRRGEKWGNLSAMIYGTRKHAAELKRWNGAKPLKVGTILYYNSPKRPSDAEQMLPIAEDFGQKYVYQRMHKGEALTLFGKRYYGEWRTWKEIAYFNSIKDPNEVPRRRLKLQPRRLGHERGKGSKLRVPTSAPSPAAE